MNEILRVAEIQDELEIVKGDHWPFRFQMKNRGGSVPDWTGYQVTLEVYTRPAFAGAPTVKLWEKANLLDVPTGWVNTALTPSETTAFTWRKATLVWVLVAPGSNPRSMLRAVARLTGRDGA